MHVTSERRLDDGVLESEFTLDGIPGLLWTPGSASAPVPLVLLGHPGGLRRTYPRLAARARHCVAEGFAAATIELPWSGDRLPSAAAEEARADLRRALEAGRPVDDGIVDRLVLPLVEQAPLVQQLDAARVQPESADDPGRLRVPLQDEHADAVQPQLTGQHHAGGPTADDDHVRLHRCIPLDHRVSQVRILPGHRWEPLVT